MLTANTCIRCEKAEPEWGSFLCKSCQDAVYNPAPPNRPDQGLPVARRVSPYHNKPKGQRPR